LFIDSRNLNIFKKEESHLFVQEKSKFPNVTQITVVNDRMFCTACGVTTKEEMQQSCPHGSSGVYRRTDVSNHGTNNNSSSSNNSSNNSNSSSHDNSNNSSDTKGTSGVVEITDQDGNRYQAVMKKSEIADNLQDLAFALRAVSVERRPASQRWESATVDSNWIPMLTWTRCLIS